MADNEVKGFADYLLLGIRIKEARLFANMSQVELSKELGISTRTLQNYEANTSEPTLSSILKVIKIARFRKNG